MKINEFNDTNNVKIILQTESGGVKIMSQHDVVEKFKIGTHPYTKYLDNQNGLQAKCDISINTLLGIYYGARVSTNEFEEYYDHKIYHANDCHHTHSTLM